MPGVIEFVNVSKEYKSWFPSRGMVRALDDFSLQVEDGEIFGFLGPNGAGKSTAIHLAMGFMRATSGHGFMLGKGFGDAATRRRVGFLAENVALYHRPAEQLVRFYGALNGMRGSSLARRAHEVVEALGLVSDARRNVRQFSRGMLQRVGLAQALVNDPQLLILDEPTSGLDPVHRQQIWDLLYDLGDAGKTIFVTTHYMDEAERWFGSVASLSCLNRGRRAKSWPVEFLRIRFRGQSAATAWSGSWLRRRRNAVRCSEYGPWAVKLSA